MDSTLQTLQNMLDAAERGEIWLGSTSKARNMVDRLESIETVLKLAIIGAQVAAQSPPIPKEAAA